MNYSVPNVSSVPANLTWINLEFSHDYFKNIFWLRLYICLCEILFITLVERENYSGTQKMSPLSIYHTSWYFE